MAGYSTRSLPDKLGIRPRKELAADFGQLARAFVWSGLKFVRRVADRGARR